MSSSCPSDQPKDFDAKTRRTLSLHYPEWGDSDLIARIEGTRRALETPRADGLPKVLYGHCECGCDRTGEFFASYAMRYNGKSFVEAMRFDESVPDRHIGYSNQMGAQWYCNYLNATGTVKIDDCDKCEPFRCRDG